MKVEECIVPTRGDMEFFYADLEFGLSGIHLTFLFRERFVLLMESSKVTDLFLYSDPRATRKWKSELERIIDPFMVDFEVGTPQFHNSGITFPI